MTAPGGSVELADGRVVSISDPAWLSECKVRFDHVQTLLRMRGVHMRNARQHYLATVQAREGEESARRLKAAILQAWGVLQQDDAGGAG